MKKETITKIVTIPSWMKEHEYPRYITKITGWESGSYSVTFSPAKDGSVQAIVTKL